VPSLGNLWGNENKSERVIPKGLRVRDRAIPATPIPLGHKCGPIRIRVRESFHHSQNTHKTLKTTFTFISNQNSLLTKNIKKIN
jgi:hypothetical protein